MTSVLQDPSKIVKTPAGGPPKAGLIWSPTRHRWVKPRAGAPGLHSPINPGLLATMSDTELDKLRSDTRKQLTTETRQYQFNDLTRVMRQIVNESKKRQVNLVLKKAVKLSKRLAAQGALDGTELLLKGMTLEAAIPLEQIRGDLARAGHMVKSIIALDPESRIIFFMDGDNSPRYCSFAGPNQGFSIQKVGYQTEIAKEYDPVDLEPDDSEEKASTEHEEREYDEDQKPGILPSGTPGEKDEHDEKYYEDHGHFGEGLGDEGFSTESRHTGRRDEIKGVMERLEGIINKLAPRPGLVPQTGNPEHPGRWVKNPNERGSNARPFNPEDQSIEDRLAHIDSIIDSRRAKEPTL